jgi:RNA polymerase sigma factor (sigma-70 family)
MSNYKNESRKYLSELKNQYPTKNAVAAEIIRLNGILNLPKGTELFLSDLHGEYEAFIHLLNNGSGIIKSKIEDIYGTDEDIIHRCIESEEEEKLLVEEILKLNDRDKSIICKRYGLFGEKELTQKELANKMSISQSYISRIEKKVIRKLKLLLKI